MSKREKNIEKVARILGVEWSGFDDNSSTWIDVDGKDYGISINFCGKGKEFIDIRVVKREWGVIDEKVVETIRKKNGNNHLQE